MMYFVWTMILSQIGICICGIIEKTYKPAAIAFLLVCINVVVFLVKEPK